uniref:Uncharacterized protein n=1 Tax=Romanomermis culicivorax TaxID=13658 RepID=A0A915IR56_ROMCU
MFLIIDAKHKAVGESNINWWTILIKIDMLKPKNVRRILSAKIDEGHCRSLKTCTSKWQILEQLPKGFTGQCQ